MLTLNTVAVLLTLLAPGQTPETVDEPKPEARWEGYRISDGLIQALSRRIAFEMSGELGLDHDQEKDLGQILKSEWTPFLNKHQERLGPMVERWIQAFVDPTPPDPKEVVQWAKTALDMQDLFLEQMEQSDAMVEKILRPDQLDRFHRHQTEIRAGFGMAKVALRNFEQGKYPSQFWDHQQERRERRLARRQKRRQREALGSSRETRDTTSLMSEWDEYVLEFVMRFGLDAAQKSSAYGVLADVKERAKIYINTNGEAIDKAVERMSQREPEEPGDRESRIALLKPFEDLFEELKSRLETIPTEAQRHSTVGPDAPTPSGKS
jgi:hypothetical protein